MIGKIILHYNILEKLGEGGMGVVYKAEDTKLKREVAIKFLPHQISVNKEERKRFEIEAQAAAALNHPKIATIHAIEESDDEMFIVMEYIDGVELKEKIRSSPLPVDESINIATQIAEGLEAAHKNGIVHRDIKSQNIMITSDGKVKIMDFGLAKIKGGSQVTKIGTTIGTAAYMSPEQAKGEEVDQRTDIWSFGVVLYEMLTGELPFKGDYEQAVIYSVLNDPPALISTLPPNSPDGIENVIFKMLEKDPLIRYESIDELLIDLNRLNDDNLERSTIAGNKELKLTQLIKNIFVKDKKQNKIENAKLLIPKIKSLTENSKYFEAYELAIQTEKILRKESTLQELMPVISDNLTINSQPKGASVYLKRFSSEKNESGTDRQYAGVTPIINLRISRGDYKIEIEKEGYTSVERIASSSLKRAEASLGISADIKININLLPVEENPEDMVFIPGGKYKLISWGAPTDIEVQLGDYFIDKYAVNNEQYKSFVNDGGYLTDRYWKYPFVKDGQQLNWEEAMKQLVDRTGLPGPRNWLNQDYPDGKSNHPVTNICWYEAAAYAEYKNKKIPTIYEWEKAARNSEYTHFVGMVMPWGLKHPKQSGSKRANFNGRGTLEINSNEFGISPFGCYNMAGNVKEWCLNKIGEDYAATGGSWEDPIYVWGDFGAFDGFYESGSLGFRCVQLTGVSQGDQGASRIAADRPTPVYTPVEESVYKGFLSHFRYDKKNLEPEVIEIQENKNWTREKISFAGEGSTRIIAYLYLPLRAQKPFQCMTFIPGGDVFLSRNLAQEAEWILGPHIKAGRAMFTVVMKGMTEREWGPGYSEPDANSVEFRNLMVLQSSELNRGLDYLETRNEINNDKLSYIGFSWGSGTRLAFAGITNRFKSYVFIGGGIDERMLPSLPEVNPINYAPYIKVPKLLLNGKQDEEHPYKTRALPLYNLLQEPKKLAMVDGGHLPSLEVRVPVINNFLDETLGPVKFA
jgi:serine/threonine protein kinase/formylglycine-generating enzyme required for sulfatase activity